MTRAQWATIAVLVIGVIVGMLEISTTNATSASPAVTHTIFLPFVANFSNRVLVLNTFSFREQNGLGYSHILGEVQNATMNAVKDITVPVNFLKSNQTVGHMSISPFLSNLPSTKKTCFDDRFWPPSDSDSFQFGEPVFSTNGRNFLALTLLNVKGQYICCYPYKITGTVRNDSQATISSVVVVGTLYAWPGIVVGCQAVNVGSLGVGQTASFEIRTPLYRDYGDVRSFVVQADSSN